MLFSPNPSKTSGHKKAVWRSVAGNYWSLERYSEQSPANHIITNAVVSPCVCNKDVFW